MKNYYRLMLGRGSKHAEECFSGGFMNRQRGQVSKMKIESKIGVWLKWIG